MPRDHARLTVLLDAEKKNELDALCASLGTTASQVLRELIADYLAGRRPQPMLPSPRAGGDPAPAKRGK